MGTSVCGSGGEGEPERPRGCEKVGECARAPGLAAGAAAAEEEGGGSRHPDPLPLLRGPPARPAARASPGGPSWAPLAES